MRMNLFKILGAVCLFYSCSAQSTQVSLKPNADNNSLLWEVSGKGLNRSSYLFGTFHLMCKDDIRFSNQLKTAVKNADTVYLEMDMDNPATMLSALFLMNMKNGKTLQELYTKDEFNRINTFFKDSLHMPVTMFEKMKPMFLVALLYPKMMPCKRVSGVEEELMKLVKEQKKEINGLETIEFQASVFDSIPYQEQAKELLKSIDSMAISKKYFDTMMNVYKSQKINEIEKLFNSKEMGVEEHQDLLLNNRNNNWVAQLNKLMRNGSVFVAVGAGHLVGKEGLISLLLKAGYRVKPLYNK